MREKETGDEGVIILLSRDVAGRHGQVEHTVARVVAGRTVFLLGRLPTLLHPGKDLLGQGRVGGQ